MPPFFSLVFPTRNRPELARAAISHALGQTFQDFEVVVLENSDRRELSHDDPRVRVVPADEVLSMPDNWERGLDHATGDYVLYLSDKDCLVPDALATLEAAITGTEAVVNYRKALLHEGFLYLQRCSHQTRVVRAAPVLAEWFARANHLPHAPMVYNSATRRSHLLDVRARTGRFFHGVGPDVASGALLAATVEEYVLVDEILALSYSGRWSYGGSHLWSAGSTSSFAREFDGDPVTTLGLVWTTAGNVCTTLLACRDAFPQLLGDHDVGWDSYLRSSLEELELRRRRGVDITADLRTLRRGAGDLYPQSVWLRERFSARRRSLAEQARNGLRERLRRHDRLRAAISAARASPARGGSAPPRDAAPAAPSRSPLDPAYYDERPCSSPEEALHEIAVLRAAPTRGAKLPARALA